MMSFYVDVHKTYDPLIFGSTKPSMRTFTEALDAAQAIFETLWATGNYEYGAIHAMDGKRIKSKEANA